MRSCSTNSGFSILSLAIAVLIVMSTLLVALKSIASARAGEMNQYESVIATQLAVELLELFVSMNEARLKEYLSANPINVSLSPYPFCALNNIIHRPSGVIANPDPLAALGDSPLDGPTPSLSPNRFYQIQAINMESMAMPIGICSMTPDTAPPLPANERYLVAVGVSWIPAKDRRNGIADNPKRIVLSTVVSK